MKKKIMFREKLIRVSIVLIVLFTSTVFIVTNINVSNLVDKSMSEKLDTISKLGLNIVESTYNGTWSVKNGNLYLGNELVNNNFPTLNEIKEKTGSLAIIYFGHKEVASNITNKSEKEIIAAKIPNETFENVYRNGSAYKEMIYILDEKYAVKYTPIKDYAENVIGIWVLAIPNSYLAYQSNQIFAMRASIVIVSILCGLLGCLLLVFYSKKYLNDIDVLKVTFLESNSNTNKTQLKVSLMSLFLIGTFLVIWVVIQGFTIGNVVNNLEDTNIKNKLSIGSELGYMLIDELYPGDWSNKSNKMYKGSTPLNSNSLIVDILSYYTEYFSTIYMDDTIISTNIFSNSGANFIGTKASDEAINLVLQQGKEYTEETTIADKKFITIYSPIKNINDEPIGMWAIGVERKASTQIAGLRKTITQISLLAIIISLVTFIFLSVKMSSNVNNFDVSLYTNIS